jgi:acyl-CoA reductase-like NAD-dependent aldehyde dehydrogenase
MDKVTPTSELFQANLARGKMLIAQEQVFGPLLTVPPFRDESDAID